MRKQVLVRKGVAYLHLQTIPRLLRHLHTISTLRNHYTKFTSDGPGTDTTPSLPCRLHTPLESHASLNVPDDGLSIIAPCHGQAGVKRMALQHMGLRGVGLEQVQQAACLGVPHAHAVVCDCSNHLATSGQGARE